jgi:hypothetical protein
VLAAVFARVTARWQIMIEIDIALGVRFGHCFGFRHFVDLK